MSDPTPEQSPTPDRPKSGNVPHPVGAQKPGAAMGSGPRRPLVVSSGLSKRDILLIVVIVVGLLSFIGAAVIYSTKTPKNTLTGVVKGRSSTGERETLLNVHPRKGVKGQTVDTGYYLDVFVPEENRTYKVIVEKDLWEKKKEGDTLSFLRPPDEQRY